MKETSVIHQIFGGYLLSQNQCESCGACSNSYDAFLDLSIEIARASSLEHALKVRASLPVRDFEHLYVSQARYYIVMS